MIKCEDGRCSYCGGGAHYEPEVRAERDALKARVEALEASCRQSGWVPASRVDALKADLAALYAQTQGYDFPPDAACVECRPDSEIVVAGFRCGRHRARAALEGT